MAEIERWKTPSHQQIDTYLSEYSTRIDGLCPRCTCWQEQLRCAARLLYRRVPIWAALSFVNGLSRLCKQDDRLSGTWPAKTSMRSHQLETDESLQLSQKSSWCRNKHLSLTPSLIRAKKLRYISQGWSTELSIPWPHEQPQTHTSHGPGPIVQGHARWRMWLFWRYTLAWEGFG
jgi:hypothetical protein